MHESDDRQTFLLQLTDALRPFATPQSVEAEAARQLGKHLGLDRAFYAEIDPDGEAAIHAEYCSAGTTSIVGHHRVENFGHALENALRAGFTLTVPDVAAWPELLPDERQAYASLAIAAQIKVPLIKDGRLVAVFGVHQRTPREWSASEVALVVDVAERTWAAVERARAEAALAAELAAMKALHELSTIAVGSTDVTEVLEAALATTISLHNADCGCVQLYDAATHTLRIAVQRGLSPAYMDCFTEVDARGLHTCGVALRTGQRKIVADTERELDNPVSMAARTGGYRAMQATPLISAAGKPLGVLSTHFRQPRQFTDAMHRLSDLVAREIVRVIERTRAESALRESEARLRSAIEVGRLGLWEWNVLTGEIHWSDEHFRLEGYRVNEIRPSYEAWVARIHPEDRAATEASLHAAMQAHTEYVHEFRVVHPDGSVHWLYGRGRFFYNDDGNVVRMIGAMVETTERREWEERQKVLVAELQHRTRNLLGVVRSMAEKTARASVDLPDFRTRFDDRLEALARVQGLLSRLNEHDRVTFDDLIYTEMAAIEGGLERIALCGPPGVRLRSSTVQTLAMALHELATNALKYGALSQPQAQLSVTWTLEPAGADGKPWLHIDWRESGVQMPDASARGTGQGRELIERALPYQLNAKTSYALERDGVRCTIAMAVSTEPGSRLAERAIL